ncbi:hypothetical protein [Abyssisolibacter fermentans]|uniref:hypothetical protein n=1 Tax=Abyssisolibacter fermentans TaxID=1766203 RepID=UPI0008325F91|nr:hypothetical protein [Abyssisolibacter fermentans]
MRELFWSNTIWYILLFVTSIVSFVFTYHKSPNRKLSMAFTFSIIGLTYLIEILLLLVFNAYTYYPGLVTDNFQDAVLGNVFSQVSVSTTAVLIAVYNLSNIWFLIFAAIYFTIEELFVKLGIYEQFWYKTIFTVIGYIPYCWLVKKWYKKLLDVPSKYVYYITLFLSVFTTFGNSIITTLKLLKIQIFRINFTSDLSRNHTSTAVIIMSCLIILMIELYKAKLHWIQKACVFVCLFVSEYVLYRTGILYIKEGWTFIVIILHLLGSYFWVSVMNQLLSNNKNLK